MVVSELWNYPTRGLVFEGGNTIRDLSDVVASSCICLQNKNIPFNVLVSDCGKRIFLFPQVLLFLINTIAGFVFVLSGVVGFKLDFSSGFSFYWNTHLWLIKIRLMLRIKHFFTYFEITCCDWNNIPFTWFNHWCCYYYAPITTFHVKHFEKHCVPKFIVKITLFLYVLCHDMPKGDTLSSVSQ